MHHSLLLRESRTVLNWNSPPEKIFCKLAAGVRFEPATAFADLKIFQGISQAFAGCRTSSHYIVLPHSSVLAPRTPEQLVARPGFEPAPRLLASVKIVVINSDGPNKTRIV